MTRYLKPKITKRLNLGGTTSFCVDAGIIEGKRYRRFFPTRPAAEEHAEKVHKALVKQGALAFSLNPRQQADAINAFEKLKERDVVVSLSEAVNFYLRHNKPQNGKKLLADVVEEFIQSVTDAGGKPRYLKALRCTYKNFKQAFVDKYIHEITRAEIEAWINARQITKNKADNAGEQRLSPLTKRNYIRDLGMLFRFAVREGHCAENVVERIRKPSLIEKPIEIFSVMDAMRILSAAHQFDSALVPYLAIGFFAGLRSSELEVLDWNEISLHGKRIEVKAENAKTSRQRYVAISENLHAWLKPHEKMEGCIVAPGWRDRLQKLAKGAEFEKWPRNGLRHSFGSYHFAFHQNSNLTATEMGHENTKMLFAHYRALVTNEDAARFWNILPPEDGWCMWSSESKKRADKFSAVVLRELEQVLERNRGQN